MILSRKFVSDYIDLDKDLAIDQIGEDMTAVGNEYDSADKLIPCTNLIIGEIEDCFDHPDSDHLHVCKVNVGSEVLNIVCGAPNVRKGLKVIVALAGAKLPGGEIKKGSIRGVESNGMICAISELGLDHKFLEEKDIKGIHELPDDAPIGVDPIKYMELDDEIVVFELTANRGDELSMLGLAYELGAIYDKKVIEPDRSYKEIKDSIIGKFDVEIKTDKCSLFLAKRVNSVVVKESPAFIKNRLIACGIRPINNVVDISNYVMLETGQPLHFYDADRLGDTIIVRNAKDKELLTTLDGIKRELSSDDIVIADKNKAIGLAGVMGGLSTEVEDDTKNILIESAIFDPVSVRKTSKKVLRSEASLRFEKGLDPNRTYMAIDRAAKLLQDYASGEVCKDMICFDQENKDNKVINITVSDINNVLGSNIPKKSIVKVFNRLGFSVSDNKNELIVTVPSRRLDINIKEDLIEEVGRIYGINNIESRLPNLGIRRGSCDMTTRQIRNKLVDLGFSETLTQIFIHPDEGHMFTTNDFDTVLLRDPLSIDKSALRSSMIQSLMKVYKYNKSHSINDVSIFEMAKCFYKKDGEYSERYKLGILATGEYYKQLGNNKNVDFYIMKGIVEELLDYLGYKNRYSFIKNDYIPNELHPGVSAAININGNNIGYIGKVHPKLVKNDVYVIEIDLDKVFSLKTGSIKYKEFSTYPSIVKDIAFVVDKNISSEDVLKTIKKSSSKMLVNIELFDLYVGDNIGKDKKSLAYKLTFMDNNRTLTEEEVMTEFDKIIEKVNNTYKSTIRNK